MAALAVPHWEAVTTGSRDLLAVLGQIDLVHPFYLAGGTALALRLGHRVSVDLTFLPISRPWMMICGGAL